MDNSPARDDNHYRRSTCLSTFCLLFASQDIVGLQLSSLTTTVLRPTVLDTYYQGRSSISSAISPWVATRRCAYPRANILTF